MLSEKQVWELAEVILQVDGGCSSCVPSLFADMLRLFPDDANRIRLVVLARCDEFCVDPGLIDWRPERNDGEAVP